MKAPKPTTVGDNVVAHVLDIFSRFIVGWMIAERESAELAKQLIATAAAHQGIQPEQLTLHADNGKPMKAKTLALLLSDLGVEKSHSRPYVSDDNPFSEAQFKTVADVVAFYEKAMPAKMQQVRDMSPEHLTRVVDFFGMFQWPAVSYLGFTNNHSIHHRGQLAAYLRALGSKVPDIYGPSADHES